LPLDETVEQRSDIGARIILANFKRLNQTRDNVRNGAPAVDEVERRRSGGIQKQRTFGN
jgi:hypothetical protein